MDKGETILFRADGNGDIGAGHVMRCISIADAAAREGHRCVFVTAEGFFNPVIVAHGHENVVLNRGYKDIDLEPDTYGDILERYAPGIIVVDSYYVTPGFFRALKARYRGRVVYIDDLALQPQPCDILINYNIYGDDWRGRYADLYGQSEAVPKLVLGSLYAPLRAEFSGLEERAMREQADDIMVSTGGSDPDHFTMALMEAIERADSGKRFHVVVGAANLDRERIYAAAEGRRDVVIHENVQRMAKLMRACDVAISAAGSTLYELCATQTPTVTYVLEDNQAPGACAFEQKGVFINCGDIRVLGMRALADSLIREAVALCANVERRRAFARRQSQVVDGRGAQRILKAFCPCASTQREIQH